MDPWIGRSPPRRPCCDGHTAITYGEQHVLWWGGLRGALALALVLALPGSMPRRDEVVLATFFVVAFSIVVQGLTMPLVLRRLGFLGARREQDNHFEQ